MNDHGAFPPAYVTDATGKPVHSWRALILPYLDPELAKEYDYNEPWDGPNNSKLHNRMPSVFRCPNDTDAPEGTTNYVAVVGNETMWPFSTSRKRDDITDGLSNTILIVETKGLNVPWLEPSDLNFATMEFKINSPSGNGIGSYHPGIACAWTAGGGRHFFRDATTPETIRALLTVAGGEKVPVTEANLPE